MDETMMEQTGNTQEKVQGLNIVMNGITINGPMFDIHDNHHVVINAASSTQGEVNGSATSAAPSPRADAKGASVATTAGLSASRSLVREFRGEPPFEDVIKTAEACQSYFWAQSSWAVVYCVCRDHLEMEMSMSEFERRVADYPLKKSSYECPAGTIQKTLTNNDYMRYPIYQWAKHGAKERATLLVEELVEKLK